MMARNGASQGSSGDEWLSADAIAELTGERVKANTVRSWWKSGALAYEVFPELGAKSNKRSSRQVVEQFLRLKLNLEVGVGGSSPAGRELRRGERAGPVADLLDTVSSLRTSVDALMEAFIAEAETNAEMSAARATADARRVEQLRHLQTMMRGYDLALATHLQPSLFDAGRAESVDTTG